LDLRWFLNCAFLTDIEANPTPQKSLFIVVQSEKTTCQAPAKPQITHTNLP